MDVPTVLLKNFYVILQNSLSLDLAFTTVMPYPYFSIRNLNPIPLKPGQLVPSLNTSLHISIIGTKSLNEHQPQVRNWKWFDTCLQCICIQFITTNKIYEPSLQYIAQEYT